MKTPLLARASGNDPLLDWFETESFVDGSDGPRRRLFMPTSPEFHMKRLLAAGWGDVWQLTSGFRNGDRGANHLEEFSILEWYRVGWSDARLMDEVLEICALALGKEKCSGAKRTTYAEAFERFAGCDPFDPRGVTAPTPEGRALFEETCRRAGVDAPECDGDERLHWLHGTVVAPRLGAGGPEFLVEWPAPQAALAKIERDSRGRLVGRRFELYVHGVELCNGYQELTDAAEQRRRFDEEAGQRRALGKRPGVRDDEFLAALDAGMPECAGVALGLDRLVMLALGIDDIGRAVPFVD